jgi:hypothetical protein
MDFKKLLQTISDLDQNKQILKESYQPVEECGIMPSIGGLGMMGGASHPPITLNVTMNATGPDGIRDLLNVLKGHGNDEPDDAISSPAGAIVAVSEPEDDMDHDMHDMGHDMHDRGHEIDHDEDDAGELELELDEYSNSPDEEYAGMSAAVPSGDDLNKPKKSFKHNYRGGDNPMSMPMHETLKHKLKNLYTEVKGR